jgi:MoaA/NifB/PqqE/SkfB family radical SAM enzyme
MNGLNAEAIAKALKLNIPLSVQLDLTCRCKDRCIHCYLDHDDHGEMTTAEIKDLFSLLESRHGPSMPSQQTAGRVSLTLPHY